MSNTGDILCERCGYVLHGLTTHDKCPECGRETARSMPSQRLGSPWQRRRSFGSFALTTWDTLLHPIARWDEVRVDAKATEWLWFVYVSAAALCWIIAVVTGVFIESFNEIHLATEWPWMAFAFLLLTGFGLAYHFGAAFATWIALALWQRVRGWRGRSPMLDVVSAHAAVGCLASPLIAIVVMLSIGSMGAAAQAWIPRVSPILWLALPLASPAAMFSLGLIGLRQLRFANRPRRAGPSAPVPTAAPPQVANLHAILSRPPMNTPLLTHVLEVAADVFGVAPASLSGASSPDTVENWDSVQHLNLVLALEARFGVQINPEDIDKLKTLAAAEKILAGLGAR